MLERRREFESLAAPLAGSLRSVARRYAGNAVSAEDLLQEAYLRAWINFDRFKTNTNFKAWLTQIVKFVWSGARRRSWQREVPTDALGDMAHAGRRGEALEMGALPDQAWEARYLALLDDGLRAALLDLNACQRTVLLMFAVGEMSYQECAAALNVPIGTVMSRLARARKRVRETLNSWAGEPQASARMPLAVGAGDAAGDEREPTQRHRHPRRIPA